MQCIFGDNWAHMGLKCLCDLESDLDLQLTFKVKRSKIHVKPQNEAMSAPIAKITLLRRDLDIKVKVKPFKS